MAGYAKVSEFIWSMVLLSMKILVAIANFGTKNDIYRDKLIREYRSMDYDVDIVVLSNIHRNLGPDIKVKVGLPTEDPWSLPFGHKQLFADNVDNYDLFIYSEDDTLLTEKNIKSFMEVTESLPDNMIAGFLRYEEGTNGKKVCSTMHSSYHWDPSSVCEYNNETFAFFTNEHGALFILTRHQLKKAIHSGGFLVPAHEGKYDKLVTAATDPYTQCGMKKMICVSRIDDFLIHHLPDIYIEDKGRSIFELVEYEQLKKMCATIINDKNHQNFELRLVNPSTKLPIGIFDKKYQPMTKKKVIDFVRPGAKKVLSVGCVTGNNERILIDKGHHVTGIPIDNIIAVLAKNKGIDVLSPDFELSLREINNRTFDCIIFDDVMQFIKDPVNIIQKFKCVLEDEGYFIMAVPNFKSISFLKKRFNKSKFLNRIKKDYCNFDSAGLHFTDYQMLKTWLKKSDLIIKKTDCLFNPKLHKINKLTFNLFCKYLSQEIIVSAAIKK